MARTTLFAGLGAVLIVALVRIAMLQVAGTAHVLGATGQAWTRFLGGDLRAAEITIAALSAWMLAPLAIGISALRARDL